MPFEHFMKLSDGKKRDILNAALEEFVQNGYDLASTNRIVERAGIAKGALFKYFETKEALFLYLCEQCSEEVASSLGEELNLPDSNFFEALRNIAFKEITLSRKRPELFALFQHLSKQPDHPVYRQALQKDDEKSKEVLGHLFTSLTQLPMRSGISLERAFHVVTWVLAGLKQKLLLGAAKDIDGRSDWEAWEKEVEAEIENTLDLLKYGFLA